MLRLTSASSTSRGDVIWHDVECGGYEADLALWEELADEAAGPVLELGCGTGRVGLHLARRGHSVTALDQNAALVTAFDEQVGELAASAYLGDARQFDLACEFGLVLAPMQLIQLFAGAEERIACLMAVATHLRRGGCFAAAIVEEVAAAGIGIPVAATEADGVFPDVREADGWVYSSLPLETVVGDWEIVVRRLRQTVSPEGELSDEVDEVRLQVLDAATLEREAEAAGLRPAGRRDVPATDAHVGSTVVLLERGV